LPELVRTGASTSGLHARTVSASPGTTALNEVTATLAREHLDPDAAFVQAGRILLRFKDVPSQLRARDAVDASAPGFVRDRHDAGVTRSAVDYVRWA
jgi:hypothetical protein